MDGKYRIRKSKEASILITDQSGCKNSVKDHQIMKIFLR